MWKDGVNRAEPQRERDGGDYFIISYFLATTDSIRQQYTAHSLLRFKTYAQQLQASHLYGQRVVVRCFFGSVLGGEDLRLFRLKGCLRPDEQARTSSFRSFWLVIATSVLGSYVSWCVDLCSFIVFLVFDSPRAIYCVPVLRNYLIATRPEPQPNPTLT